MTQVEYDPIFKRFLEDIRRVKAPVGDYREALEGMLTDLEMELESLGDPDDDLDTEDSQ